MIYDNRTYYRLLPASYTDILCPGAFLEKRPIEKTPADDEGGATYYTASDGLTIEQALTLANIPVTFYDESGDAPIAVEDIASCDRVVFGLWNVYGSESRAFDQVAMAEGADPDEVIIPTANLGAYLKDGTTPSDQNDE